MITYLNVKTGVRYPEYGCLSSFSEKKFFIRGFGSRKFKPKEWKKEEIPDLAENYTEEQWITYTNEYGTNCSQEFLRCCDYIKPQEAYRILNSPKNKQKWIELSHWFKSVFGTDFSSFIDGHCLVLANTYQIDILKFEKYLINKFDYSGDSSMKDFMVKKFGKDNVDKFSSMLLKSE